MIKAEVIEHEGYEVPNWVSKCKDVITSAPVLAALTIVVVAGFGVLAWNHNRPAYSSQPSVQSQPVSGSSLQVISSDNLPAAASATANSATQLETPVGPAPTTSLSELQSTGGMQNNARGLNQALEQTLQAGKASQALYNIFNR